MRKNFIFVSLLLCMTFLASCGGKENPVINGGNGKVSIGVNFPSYVSKLKIPAGTTSIIVELISSNTVINSAVLSPSSNTYTFSDVPPGEITVAAKAMNSGNSILAFGSVKDILNAGEEKKVSITLLDPTYIGGTFDPNFSFTGVVDVKITPYVPGTITAQAAITSPSGLNVTVGSISTVQTGVTQEASVILLFDSSGSMSGSDPNYVRKDAGKQFVDIINSKVRVAVMDFGGGVDTGYNSSRLLQSFTSDINTLKAAIDKVIANDGTPLYESLYFDALPYLSKEDTNRTRWIVMLTDGAANDYVNEADAITLAKQNSIAIYTFGYGSPNSTALNKLATETGGAYFYQPDNSAIISTFAGFSSAITQGYLKVPITISPVPAAGTIVQGTLTLFINGVQTQTENFTLVVPSQTS